MVPMMAREPASTAAFLTLEQDRTVVTWWGSVVECASAIARKEREEGISPRSADVMRLRLTLLANTWTQVEPADPVRQNALRVLRTHRLRAADALQLAAAIAAAAGTPATLPFVTLDERLARAASAEGFPVIMPGQD